MSREQNLAKDGAADFNFKLSVCICTRNRPTEACQAVQSVLKSTRRIHEIIVSDDSTNGDTRAELAQGFHIVRFVEGPRKGLCANRNNALDYVTGTHVLFIDDDVIMAPGFVSEVEEALRARAPGLRDKTVIAGLERKHGTLVFPRDQTFLGHQSRRYFLEEALNTIVINAAVFPAELFGEIRFDENLIYGSDEVDLATRAVRLGYVYVLCLQAVNDHYPAAVNRDYYAAFIDASKLYVTFKRYYFTESRPLKALAFAIIAPLHLLAHRLKSRRPNALPDTFRTVSVAVKYLMRMDRSAGRPKVPAHPKLDRSVV